MAKLIIKSAKKIYSLLLISFFLFNFVSTYQVITEELSISDLPFQGYFIAPEEFGVNGILFENNQLLIYFEDDSRYSHGDSYHMDNHDHHGDHEESEEDEHAHEHDMEKQAPDHELIESLFELNSFPYPNFKNYTDKVRQLYIEDYGVPYDLQATYVEIAEQITPDMSQLDIIKLINNHIPGIYYTEKEGFSYFIVANPTISEENDEWLVSLFGNELFKFSRDGLNLVDQNGTTYEYIDGIRPN